MKTITVRKGYRSNYRPGPAEFVLDRSRTIIPIRIEQIHFKTFDAIGEAELKGEGVMTYDALLHDMKQFYPDMDDTSPITVVDFLLH